MHQKHNYYNPQPQLGPDRVDVGEPLAADAAILEIIGEVGRAGLAEALVATGDHGVRRIVVLADDALGRSQRDVDVCLLFVPFLLLALPVNLHLDVIHEVP
jgi:hypothetical protein